MAIGKFNQALQERLITVLFNYKELARPLMPAVEPAAFTNPSCQLVIRLAKGYFNKYRDFPNKEVLLDLIAKESPRIKLSDEEVKQLAHVIYLISSNGIPKDELPYLKDELITLIKYSKIKSSLLSAFDHLNNGSLDDALAEMQLSKRASVTEDLGREYCTDFEKRLAERVQYDTVLRVPTMLAPLDEALRGGLGPGELAIAMAPSGTGKSMFLVNLGFGAVLHKQPVVHITLEMSALQTLSRFDSLFTGCPIEHLARNKDRLLAKKEELQKFQGLLFVKQFPPRVCKTTTISSYLDQLKNEGVHPGLLVVDYGDLLSPPRRYDQVRHELTAIFEDLRRVAVEFQLPVWTATQANRQSIGQYNVTEKHVAEAYSKVMTCDVLLSLNQTVAEEQAGRMRIKLLKVRDAKKGLSFPVVTDFENARIRVAEDYSKLDHALGTSKEYSQ